MSERAMSERELTDERCDEIARDVYNCHQSEAPITRVDRALIRAGWQARAALAQEPVAPFRWYYSERNEHGVETFYKFCTDEAEARAHVEKFGGTYFPVYAAPPAAQEAPSLLARHTNHPDDAAVDRFATAMKIKMAEKRDEGRSGWDDKDQCTGTYLRQLLRGHVAKGDPVDVGNLAMMLWNRGEATQEPQCTCGKPRVTLHERGCPMAAQEQRSTGAVVSTGTGSPERDAKDASQDAESARFDSSAPSHQEPPASRQEDSESEQLALALGPIALILRGRGFPNGAEICERAAARLAQVETMLRTTEEGRLRDVQALRAENERLAKDAARLDWLERWLRAGAAKGYKRDSFTFDSDSTIRAAIDRALGGSDGQ